MNFKVNCQVFFNNNPEIVQVQLDDPRHILITIDDESYPVQQINSNNHQYNNQPDQHYYNQPAQFYNQQTYPSNIFNAARHHIAEPRTIENIPEEYANFFIPERLNRNFNDSFYTNFDRLLCMPINVINIRKPRQIISLECPIGESFKNSHLDIHFPNIATPENISISLLVAIPLTHSITLHSGSFILPIEENGINKYKSRLGWMPCVDFDKAFSPRVSSLSNKPSMVTLLYPSNLYITHGNIVSIENSTDSNRLNSVFKTIMSQSKYLNIVLPRTTRIDPTYLDLRLEHNYMYDNKTIFINNLGPKKFIIQLSDTKKVTLPPHEENCLIYGPTWELIK